MTGEHIVQIVTALVPALLAFLSLVGIVVTAVIAYKTSKKVAVVETHQAAQTKVVDAAALIAVNTSKKADEIIVKTEQIHSLTNSNLSAVTAALEKLKAASDTEIKELRAAIQQLQEDKKETAAIAAKLADKVPTTVPGGSSPTQTLSDVTMTKSDVVIEGTLETKK